MENEGGRIFAGPLPQAANRWFPFITPFRVKLFPKEGDYVGESELAQVEAPDTLVKFTLVHLEAAKWKAKRGRKITKGCHITKWH